MSSDPRIVREPAAQLGVERRAAVAVRGLPAEDLRLPRLFRSAGERRLGLLDDLAELRRIADREIREHLPVELDVRRLQAGMNWLYESPFARAPALMRMIQSLRNSRFRTLRSR